MKSTADVMRMAMNLVHSSCPPRPLGLAGLLIALLGLQSTAAAAELRFAWPHGAQAAVSLAYDDALDSQLDTAIPALDKAGLKASFYLTLGSDVVKRRMADWRAAAARGHELGNHILFHQCSRSAPDRSWVTPGNDLDQISAEQLVAPLARPEGRGWHAGCAGQRGRRQRRRFVQTSSAASPSRPCSRWA